MNKTTPGDKLVLACNQGDEKLLKNVLYHHDDDINEVRDSTGNTLLNICTCKGYLNCVKVLVSLAADANAVNADGNNALHIAVIYDQMDCLAYFLSTWGGVLVNERNNRGYSPLHIAVHCEGYAAIEILLSSRKVYLDIADDSGWTPVASCAIKGNIPCLKLMMERGADIDMSLLFH